MVLTGGSSSILRRALPEAGFIAWASLIITTRLLASYGFRARV
jgi:hypothetical protein